VSKRPRILDLLKTARDPAADHALVAGLLEVDAPRQSQLIEILLARGQDIGFNALPEVFDRLQPAAQSAVVANTARLFGALRASVRSPAIQTRVNTIEIIRRSQNPRLAYLAAAAVHDGSTHIRAEAAATLRHLTELHCTALAETTALLQEAVDGDGTISYAVDQTLKLLADERRQLIAAVRDALSTYESHHRTEVLQAAMYLADELQADLFAEGTLKRGKLTHAMMEVFTSAPSPRLAAFAYIALCYPDLRRRILTILGNLRDSKFFCQFIRLHWLARDPAVRRNLATLRSLAWLSDGFEAAFTLPPDVAALTPGWLLHLGLPSDQKVALLMNLLLVDHPQANRAAVWALTRILTPGSTLALQGVLDHEDPSLRRIAEHEIRHRQVGEGRRRAGQPQTNRPPEWAALLEKAGLTENFDDLWQHFDRVPPALAKAAGHHVLRYIPAFATLIQLRLVSTLPADRLRALRLLSELSLTGQFTREIFAAANDPVPEVRSASMAGLGRIGDATSRRILERALNDESPAVQAAAIDALDHMGAPKRLEMFAPKSKAADPSVRAAAIRSLLKMHVPQAAVDLIAMLQDTRPDHRCSALWIADQLRLVVIAPRIAEVAATDPDPRIARIAQHVGRRLARLQNLAESAMAAQRRTQPAAPPRPAPGAGTPAGGRS
jgi:HEAT repeat protein